MFSDNAYLYSTVFSDELARFVNEQPSVQLATEQEVENKAIILKNTQTKQKNG